MTHTINADRGEVGLTLGGHVYPMLPTFAAANAIESQLGPAAALLARFAGRVEPPTFHQLAVIATECIKAAGADRKDDMLSRVNAERVGELIYAEGLGNDLFKSFIQILTNICTGGTTRKKVPAAQAASGPPATSESPTAS